MQGSRSEKMVEKSFFFFFQAEDGIRDYKVTGVQTCALPISVSIGVSGQADDASGHLADVLLSAREDSEEGTAEIHRRAKGLALPDHDVRSEIGRASCRERV